MIYDCDLDNLISQWQQRMTTADSSYKDALNDCIYDLSNLMDKAFEEETLIHDVLEEQIKEDAKFWEDYEKAFLANNGLIAV